MISCEYTTPTPAPHARASYQIRPADFRPAALHAVPTKEGLLEERIQQVRIPGGPPAQGSPPGLPGQHAGYRARLSDVEPVRRLPQELHRALLHAPAEEAVQQGRREPDRERPPDVHPEKLPAR